MNDLPELRETLDSHAALDDRAATARVVAVHQRVRGVRRRRRVAVAGVAVAAVAAVAVGLNLPSDDEPDPANPNDLDAPTTITSTGYTYELESTTTHEHKASVKVSAADSPKLVAWGTEGGADDPVRVSTPAQGPTVSSEDAFGDFYVIRPGESARISVTGAEGEVSLATYTLAGPVPAGVTKDGITFRDNIGVWDLVAAKIGDLGVSEVTFDVTLPTSRLVRLTNLCMGLPKGYWVNLAVDGKGVEFSDHLSCDEDGFDPGSGSNSVHRRSALGKPGAIVPVRIWVSRSMQGEEPVDDAELVDVRLGASVYAVDPAFPDTTMSEPEAVVESGGHTWQQTQGFGSTGGGDLVQKVRGDGPHLVMLTYRTPSPLTITFTADGDQFEARQVSKGAGGIGEFLVPADTERLRVAVGSAGSERTTVTVALYERAD